MYHLSIPLIHYQIHHKKITYQKLTPAGLQVIGAAVETMAAAEGLDAHKNAITIRLQTL
jgi:histidinol dehydrogenase